MHIGCNLLRIKISHLSGAAGKTYEEWMEEKKETYRERRGKWGMGGIQMFFTSPSSSNQWD